MMWKVYSRIKEPTVQSYTCWERCQQGKESWNDSKWPVNCPP